MPQLNKLLEKALKLKKEEKFEKAIEILEELMKQNPHSEEVKRQLISVLFDYGGYLSDVWTEGYDKAVEYFKRIIELDTDNYRAWYNLGIAYFHIEKPEEALKSFNKALKIKPDYFYCYYNIGLLYEVVDKDYEKALLNYEKALSYNNNFMYALRAKNEILKKIDIVKFKNSNEEELELIRKTRQGNQRKCGKCGQINRENANFCDNCGEKL